MGVGPTEIMLVLVGILLLFGPGAVLVWWFMTQAKAVEPDAKAAPPVDPAIATARERFARGEITAEEPQEITRVLDS